MLSCVVVLIGNICVILFTIIAGITATIIQGPSNTVAEIGGEVKLDCSADYVPINFWVLSQSNIGGYLDIVGPGCSVNSPFDDHYEVELLGGGTTCNLIVFNITMDQAGVYECLDEASYRFFSILTVIDPSPNIYANTTNGVVANETVQIECRYFYNGSLSPAPTLRPYIYWTDVDGQNVTSLNDSTTDDSVWSLLAVKAGRQDILPYTAHVYLQLIPTFTDYYANNIPSVNLSTSYLIIEVFYAPGSMIIWSTVSTTDNCVSKPENLTCTADANPPAQYNWVDLSNNATTAGAVKSITSGGQYQCIAYNNIRSITHWVAITATEASCYSVNNMTISGSSCTGDSCYCVGNQSATITCVAHGFPGPTYEWSYGNVGLYLGSNQTIEAMYDGIYRCTASNVYGGTRYDATVSVNVFNCRIAATITEGPSNAVVEIGDQVKLNCTADEPIDYWVSSSTDQLTIIGPGCSIVNSPFGDHYTLESFGGGTTCNLIVFNITTNQGGVYRCLVGVNSFSSILTVIDSPPIIGANDTAGVLENDSVQITCIYFFVGSLAPAPTLRPYIYWTDFYGQNVSSSYNYTLNYQVNSQITVKASRQDIMPYTAHVYLQLIPTFTDGYANNTPTVNISTSSPIIEVLYSPGNISIWSTVSTADDCVYKPENLTCTTDANPPAEYNWVDVSNNAATAGAVKSITSGGQYMCIAFNNIRGILTHMVTKTTTEANCYPVTSNSMTISGSSCTSNTCYCVGNQSAAITCVAQGFPGPTYEWWLGNAYLGSNQTIDAMYDGIYRCTASNEYGGIRYDATVSVNVFNCKDPCNLSPGLTTASTFSSAVGSTTDDPCTTISTRAETTAAYITTLNTTTIRPTTTTITTQPVPSSLPTSSRTTTTPPLGLCYPNPCRNGATCIDNGSNFICICAPGFTSQTCDIEINECESIPCYPFGKCTDLIDDYNCSCNPGYEPLPNNTKTCNEINFCAKETQPCQNGGTCVNQNALSRYYCLCPVLDGKQYVGLLCETELITKPIVDGRISPTSGIIAGGADVTIRGQGMNVFEPLGAYLIDTTPSTMPSLYAYVIPNLTLSGSITVRVPPAQLAYVDRNLLMIVEYTGPINVTTEKENLRFKYTGNPIITAIEPTEILVTGGVHLTVSGSNMDTVQNPMMDITTVVVNKTTGHSETNHSLEICSVKNASAMTCLVPYGIVPSAFFNDTKPIGESRLGVVHLESSFRHNRGRRRKRAAVSNLTDDAGNIFEMYLGFRFDEYPKYSNPRKSPFQASIALVLPQFNFTSGSSVNFVSNKMYTISLHGSHLTHGCSMADYQVSVSNAPCNVTSLTDNELQCRPPKEEPTINGSSSFCVSRPDLHPVMVFIGGKPYLGCCLRYTTDHKDLIIAVTVGCVVAVVIIILVAILVYKRHKMKQENDLTILTFLGKKLFHKGDTLQRSVKRDNIFVNPDAPPELVEEAINHAVNANRRPRDVHQPKEGMNSKTTAADPNYLVAYDEDAVSTRNRSNVGVKPGKETIAVKIVPTRRYPTDIRSAALAEDDYLKPRDGQVKFKSNDGIDDNRGDSSGRTREKYGHVDDIDELSSEEYGSRPISEPNIDYLILHDTEGSRHLGERDPSYLILDDTEIDYSNETLEQPRRYPTGIRSAALTEDDYMQPRDVFSNNDGGDSSGRTRDKYGHVEDMDELSIEEYGSRPISEPNIDYLILHDTEGSRPLSERDPAYLILYDTEVDYAKETPV